MGQTGNASMTVCPEESKRIAREISDVIKRILNNFVNPASTMYSYYYSVGLFLCVEKQLVAICDEMSSRSAC